MIPLKDAGVQLSAEPEEHRVMITETAKTDHVNGGELSSREVQKTCQLDLEYLKKMQVLNPKSCSPVKKRTAKEPIKVKCEYTLKSKGIHRSRLVAKEFRRGSKDDGHGLLSDTTSGVGRHDHVFRGDSPIEPIRLLIPHRHQLNVRSVQGREAH